MIVTLKKHWIIIVFALIIGCLTALPTVRSIANLGGGEFRGVYPIFNFDRLFYMSMTQDVYEGHLGLGNAYVAEHKNDPYVQPPLGEIIMAGFARLTGLNVPNALFVLEFVLPMVIVLLLYLIFYCLTESRIAAIFLTAFYTAIFVTHYYIPINPQFSFIPFFLGIYFIIRVFIRPSENNRSIIIYSSLAGLMTAILVYIYPFFWTSLFVLYFMLSIVFYMALGRDIKYLKNIIYFISPFIIFISPYLYNLFQAVKSPYYAETISRYGLFNSHLPSCYYLIAMLTTTMLALIISKKIFIEKKQWYFALCLVFSGVILAWQNIITGKFMQFSTHYYRTTVIFSLMAFAIIIYNFLKVYPVKTLFNGVKKISAKMVIVFCLFLLFLFQPIHNHIAYTIEWFNISKSKQEMLDLQKYATLFNWLNNNTAPESVIYSMNGQLTNYLTVYTRNNVYLPNYGAVNLMSDDELENRWLSRTIFDKIINRDYVENTDIWVNKFIDKYQSQQTRKKVFSWLGINLKASDRIVPLEVSAKFVEKYEKYKLGDPEELLKNYKLDYLVITEQDKNWQDIKEIVESYNYFKLQETIDGFYIYKII